MTSQPYLKLYRPPLKSVCLEWFFPDDKQAGERFADYVYANCNRRYGWFHQGGSDNFLGGWHLFEFWNYDRHTEGVLAFAKAVAKEFKKELIVELE